MTMQTGWLAPANAKVPVAAKGGSPAQRAYFNLLYCKHNEGCGSKTP